MSDTIRFWIVDIGDFSDGSLVVDKRRRRYANAAVIKFQTREDCQKFAKLMDGMSSYNIERAKDSA